MDRKDKIKAGFKEYWINVAYITLFFGIFTDYRRLILAHYDIVYKEYGISVIKALILAKVILIAEHLHVSRRFVNKPLIVPTLYNAFLFTVCVAVVSIIEATVRGYLKMKGFITPQEVFIKCFTYEWFAEMLVAYAFFIPFFGIKELSRVLGKGRISRLFFKDSTDINLNSGGSNNVS